MAPKYSPIRLVAALVLLPVVWEVCARVDDARSDGAPFLGIHDQSVLLTSDAYGVTGRPGAHYSKWRMNSLGFRGAELLPGRARILCVGASETFGLYEPEGQEFPRQLERLLNARAASPGYQVVNAGLPGQSLSSFARRAAVVVGQVRPALVVVYPSLAIYIDPPPESFVASAQPPAPRFRLRIATRLADLLSGHVPEAVRAAVQRAAIRLQTRHRTILTRIPEANVDRFRRDLAHLLDVLAGEHVPVLLVTHATRFGAAAGPADGPMLTAWRTLHPTLEEDGFLDMERRLNDVLRDEAAARGLRLVDAARQLRGAENFVEFVHFTPRGAGALARAIADAIGGEARVSGVGAGVLPASARGPWGGAIADAIGGEASVSGVRAGVRPASVWTPRRGGCWQVPEAPGAVRFADAIGGGASVSGLGAAAYPASVDAQAVRLLASARWPR